MFCGFFVMFWVVKEVLIRDIYEVKVWSIMGGFVLVGVGD